MLCQNVILNVVSDKITSVCFFDQNIPGRKISVNRIVTLVASRIINPLSLFERYILSLQRLSLFLTPVLHPLGEHY